MAEVGSQCETDFDCKPRNFCWKLSQNEDKQCLEKFSAPDNVEFLWDAETYPDVNRDSIYAHGRFCASGIAWRKANNVAQCVTLDEIWVTSNNTHPHSAPYNCTPEGKEKC